MIPKRVIRNPYRTLGFTALLLAQVGLQGCFGNEVGTSSSRGQRFRLASQSAGAGSACAISDGSAGGARSLPVGQAREVIERIARENSAALRNSCTEHGGNNEFLFKVVTELRKLDPRWGLNWKRGNVGDLSQDVINYYRGAGSFEGGTDTYIIDIIGGHCGDNPQPAFIDVTQATQSAGTIGRWTIKALPSCAGNVPGNVPAPAPAPAPEPAPQPAPPTFREPDAVVDSACNALGSIVNNGYESKNLCEHSWSFKLACVQEANSCWIPQPGTSAVCNASGSFVNNGYASEYECEHTFSYTMSCGQDSNSCWKPIRN